MHFHMLYSWHKCHGGDVMVYWKTPERIALPSLLCFYSKTNLSRPWKESSRGENPQRCFVSYLMSHSQTMNMCTCSLGVITSYQIHLNSTGNAHANLISAKCSTSLELNFLFGWNISLIPFSIPTLVKQLHKLKQHYILFMGRNWMGWPLGQLFLFCSLDGVL